MPKIVYDRKNCEGFFVCSAADPDTWGEDRDENKADLLKARDLGNGLFELDIDDDQLADAMKAAEGCPSDVIKVVDDQGNLLAGPRALPIER